MVVGVEVCCNLSKERFRNLAISPKEPLAYKEVFSGERQEHRSPQRLDTLTAQFVVNRGEIGVSEKLGAYRTQSLRCRTFRVFYRVGHKMKLVEGRPRGEGCEVQKEMFAVPVGNH